MGSGQKRRWKFPSFSSSHSRSPSNSSSATTPRDSIPSSPLPQTTPKEFLCPISAVLMADPVILPTGQTFERGCIKACIDLGIPPPPPPLPLPPKDAAFAQHQHQLPSSAAFLVPNLALRSTILSWCDERGLPRPRPLDPAAAIRLVQSLTTTSTTSSSTPSPTSSFRGASAEGDVFFDSCASPPPPPPVPQLAPAAKSTPSYYSSSSSEIIEDESITTNTTITNSSSSSTSSGSNPPSNSPLEAQIIAKFKSPEVSDQEEGLLHLRHATRDSKEQRSLLCTPTLVAALRPFLLSRLPSLQSNAAAALVNLSLDPASKTPIVRSGAVPPLIAALGSLHPETRSHAAAALFSLAVEEENRAAIGALGAIPPLLKLVSRRAEDVGTRRDAALAVYHLSSGCSTNRAKLAKLDGARTFLAIAADEEEAVTVLSSSTSLGGVAIMVMANLAGCNEGRMALMDAGAVEAVVRVLRRINATGATQVQGRMEQCVAVLYGMSKGSLRFRGLAKAAGVEEVLSELTAETTEDGGGEEEGKGRVGEMARRTLRAIGGEGFVGGFRGDSIISDGGDTTMSGGIVSNNGGVMSFPRLQRGGRPAQFSGANSTEF